MTLSFKGPAKRLEDIDLPRIGAEIGVGEDIIHAVMDTEAAGGGFDAKGRPKILFEPHIFYRQLKGDKRDRAVAEGLAYSRWKRKYPKDSYPRLERAMKIDEAAALKSASWGLGQVLGINFSLAGYDTIQAMVQDFTLDEDNHLEAMVQFIISSGLDDELRVLEAKLKRGLKITPDDCRPFVRGYNGTEYEKNDYHIIFAGNINKWAKIKDTPFPAVEPAAPASAVRGDPEVWHVQRRLKAMNYNPGGLDGIWGGMTSGAISGFLNDRESNIDPPTSASGFVKVLDPLKVEISVAESEQFERPIAPERAEATVEEIGEKLPEVKASAQSERLGFWGSIAAAVASVVTGVSKFLGDAVEWLNPLKTFAGDIHWSVWVGGALALSAALYYVSRKSGQAKNAATQAYKEGARV